MLITNIGTFAQRAGVTKEALTVVYDENVAKKDQVAELVSIRKLQI